MNVHILSETDSIIHQFISELRDVSIQKDRLRFRRNIERVGQIMAYEVSKHLKFENKAVRTPLGTHTARVLAQQPVLATILRAGLSMHQGVLSFFDQADCAFISAYRKHESAEKFEIVVEYLASPDLTGKTLLLIDPMLATGQSIDLTYQAILTHGKPASLHVLALIASKPGVEYLQRKLPEAQIWVGAVDDVLNQDAYIVPGLGDAGDLSFGEKCGPGAV